MTPQEKAIELREKFYNVEVISADWQSDGMVDGKQCALICVDEILKNHYGKEYSTNYQYWQEVKTEIEKL